MCRDYSSMQKMGGDAMLNIYCQYSYAGYKIYRLYADGIKEVTATERYDLPKSSITYFSRYGIKEALLPLPEGPWMLLVHDIPTNELDDMGRKKNCSLQIIATDKEAKSQLVKTAIIIANEMSSFQKLFAAMFAIKDTLTFDYDSFQTFLSETGTHGDMKKYGKPWDRVYTQDAALILYSGSSLDSSLSEVQHLISDKDKMKAVSLQWDSATCRPSAMNGMKCIYDLIQRILDRLNIWKD